MIRSYLGTIDWRDAFRNCSCSDMQAKFKSVVHISIEFYVPKYHKISKIKCSWSSNFIRSLIKHRIKYGSHLSRILHGVRNETTPIFVNMLRWKFIGLDLYKIRKSSITEAERQKFFIRM